MGGVIATSAVRELEPTPKFPAYYTKENVTKAELKVVTEQFEMILKNVAPGYLENLKLPTSNYKNETSIVFFFDSFYERLFTIHPSSANLFSRGMRCQGNALVQMINIALTVYADDKTFDGALRQIAEFHYQRGVKAYEYGIVGEILLFALKVTLGPLYTDAAQTVWIKVYSRMLRVMIPVATELEFYNSLDFEPIPFLLPPAPPVEEESKQQMNPSDNNQTTAANTSMGCPHMQQQQNQSSKASPQQFSGKCPHAHLQLPVAQSATANERGGEEEEEEELMNVVECVENTSLEEEEIEMGRESEGGTSGERSLLTAGDTGDVRDSPSPGFYSDTINSARSEALEEVFKAVYVLRSDAMKDKIQQHYQQFS